MAVHVFIDNSNIWISLQNLWRKLEDVPPVAVRVYLKKLEVGKPYSSPTYHVSIAARSAVMMAAWG